MKKYIETPNAPAAIGPYSQAIDTGNLLFLSGVMPIDPSTGNLVESDITKQASQIMKNVDAILKEAGYTQDNVVKTTCFLSDINNFSALNEVYGKYFTSKPCRSCVAVKDLPKQALVEVEIIASK